MSELARIRDAANVAAKAAFPTDILVTKAGFRVTARNGGVSIGKTVTHQQLELEPLNPLVEAVRRVNRDLAG